MLPGPAPAVLPAGLYPTRLVPQGHRTPDLRRLVRPIPVRRPRLRETARPARPEFHPMEGRVPRRLRPAATLDRPRSKSKKSSTTPYYWRGSDFFGSAFLLFEFPARFGACKRGTSFDVPLSRLLFTAFCSLISERQLIQISGIRRLHIIPVHLIVDRSSPPTTGCRPMVVVVVQGVGYSVQSDGLIQQFVVRGALHLNCQMVPGICIGVAGDPGVHPSAVEIVPDVPFVAPSDTTFVAPNEAHTVEELIDIELQRLRRPRIAHPKINVIGEVV